MTLTTNTSSLADMTKHLRRTSSAKPARDGLRATRLSRDVLYIDEQGGTTMISAPMESRFGGPDAADMPFTQRSYRTDDLPQALVDSIILNLLEDFTRLECDPHGAPQNTWRTGDFGQRSEPKVASSDVARCAHFGEELPDRPLSRTRRRTPHR